MENLTNILIILIVILSFNAMIFFHELGHFLAARWRGLQVDKFQIWFGRPIWSKTINRVQYGLGWIPAGGFVALPQLAPMESIEGERLDQTPLPPVKPIDKIIVAIAGPIFSLLLAIAAAIGVWVAGKPADIIPSTTVGYIQKDSPAEKAGFQLGDKILKVNDSPVIGFAGNLNCITESIVLSKGEKINFTVERPGEARPLTLVSTFETEKKKWFERRGLRKIGISFANDSLIANTLANSPAEKAGLKKSDQLLAINGQKMFSSTQVEQQMKALGFTTLNLTINRENVPMDVTITPAAPSSPIGVAPMLGLSWELRKDVDMHIVYPNPLEQCKTSVKTMIATFSALLSPRSSIGVDQLSGPISIGKAKFDLLKSDENGWRRLLAFIVLINVNLAIFNMLPFPVLDGGHITLSLMEIVRGKPVKIRILEYVQSACAILLMALFLFITTKDIGSFFGHQKSQEVRFDP
jgi:regulator of sigma E protease